MNQKENQEKRNNHLKAELLDVMGSDLSVVNAARVSFDKFHNKVDQSDERLINYLARHNHWTPFGHASASFRVTAPIFIARQLGKHQVGLVWNEISRRYVDSPPEFFVPDSWRARHENKKQGSHDAVAVKKIKGDLDIDTVYEYQYKSSLKFYNSLIDSGVCPEQARMVLPQSMVTEWVWTGSLIAFSRICNLRIKPDAQKESRIVAQDIDCQMRKLFPLSWKALRHEKDSTKSS